jgi:FlaA1/EpsC-like NDP-sugar epimerase
MQIMETIFRDQVVMVTGAAGSIGQELVRQLIPLGPAEIRR